MRNFMLIIGVLGILLCVFSCAPYRTVQPLPSEGIVDIHCHVAGTGEGPDKSGCFISDEYREDFRYKSHLQAFGVTEEELKTYGDYLVVERLSALLNESQFVKKAVVLALDGVYDDHGLLDTKKTQVYVPNKFVAAAVSTYNKKYNNLLFGASVNPYRKDWLRSLEQAKADGAVLVKWIPSVMDIDPSDCRIIPFYKKLKELKLPLLTHAGKEFSFPHADDTLSDPERLRLPLKMGVKVIAAHIASSGKSHGVDSHDRLAQMMKEYPNLYADISALTQLNRHYMKQALTLPEFEGRLCYGSDFPLINASLPIINIHLVSPWYQIDRLWVWDISEIYSMANPWDRDVKIKQLLGTPTDVFRRSWELIGQ